MVVATGANIGRTTFKRKKKVKVDREKNCMPQSTLTNINCVIMSMAVYSELAAMVNQSVADSNESSFSTAIWEFES